MENEKGMKILVAEDNVLTQTVLSALFESLGFDVVGIMAGNEVLPFLEENKVDIIILDLELPGMRGDEIYLKIQENESLKNIPVIPFSAHSQPGSFGKLFANTITKLSELDTRDVGVEQPKDINEKLVNEVTSILIQQGKSFPPELLTHYSKMIKIPEEDVIETLKKGV